MFEKIKFICDEKSPLWLKIWKILIIGITALSIIPIWVIAIDNLFIWEWYIVPYITNSIFLDTVIWIIGTSIILSINYVINMAVLQFFYNVQTIREKLESK